MTNNTEDIDRGWKKISKLFSTIKKTSPSVAVGIQGSEAELLDSDHDGMTNVELAIIHEFGSEDGAHPPARPFISTTFDDNKAEIQATLDKIGIGAFKGETPIGSLSVLGEEIITKIKEKVASGLEPPLSQITLDNPDRPKAGTVPLWASGQLMNSLSAAIVDPSDLERN